MYLTTPGGLAGLAVLTCMVLRVLASCDDDKACPSTQGFSVLQMKQRVKKKEPTVPVVIHYTNADGAKKSNALNADGDASDLTHMHIVTARVTLDGLKKLQEDPDIDYVDQDNTKFEALVHHRGEPIWDLDSKETQPYGLELSNTTQVAQGSTKIKVCVVDSGYGKGHPDLPTDAEGTAPIDAGYGKWDVDWNSHGTHCAGTIGAIGKNDKGVTSCNPDPHKFNFHIGKGLDDSGGFGTTASVLGALEGCIEAGAKVISMSLGGGEWLNASATAYREAYENDGVLIVAAAGNKGNAEKTFPASYPHVMSVAAVDSNGVKASFSQYNDQVEIAAAGVNIISTITMFRGTEFTYMAMSGTSMATPHVSGVAALVWSHFPSCTNHQIRNVLDKTARDRGALGCDIKYGYGIADAKAAYDLLAKDGCGAGDLSDKATGGCGQIPGAPTPAPTPAPDCSTGTCTSRNFTVILQTDEWGQDTSWQLVGADGNSAGGSTKEYESSKEYTESMCLNDQEYTFTISDQYGDGICCQYGKGSYKLYVNGKLMKEGGKFEKKESTTIEECKNGVTPDPRPGPTPAPAPASTTPYPSPLPYPSPNPSPWKG